MKKITTILCLCFICTVAFSQDKKSVQWGIRIANNSAKMTRSMIEGSVSSRHLSSFQLGAYAEFNIKDLSFQPGLNLNGKGGVSPFSLIYSTGTQITVISGISTMSLYYLELPLNAVYKFPVKSSKIYIGAGPYTSLGLFGRNRTKTDYTTTFYGSSEIEKTSGKKKAFGNDSDQVKRFDFGANFSGGIELKKGFTVGLNYGLGLANISNQKEEGSLSNQAFSLTFGYLFKSGK